MLWYRVEQDLRSNTFRRWRNFKMQSRMPSIWTQCTMMCQGQRRLFSQYLISVEWNRLHLIIMLLTIPNRDKVSADSVKRLRFPLLWLMYSIFKCNWTKDWKWPSNEEFQSFLVRLKATNPHALEAEGLCRLGCLGLYTVKLLIRRGEAERHYRVVLTT